MRSNPVEALAIINPEEKPRHYEIGLAIAAGAVALGFYYRRKCQQEAVQQPLGTVQNRVMPLWLKLVLVGGVGYGVYRLTCATKEKDGDITENLGGTCDCMGRNVTEDRYFVRVVGTRETYPKKGGKYYPEGYPLRSAVFFARIGSKTGNPRKIFRGSTGGQHIRTYEEGRRVWPKTAAQAKKLRPVERPSGL